MIRPTYAIQLARTKLYAKQSTIAISISIASLLFALIITIIIIFNSAQNSAVVFIEKANNHKYLVQVQPVMPQSAIPGINTPLTSNDIKFIRAYEDNYYAQLKAKYKALSLTYTEPDASDSLLTPDAYAGSAVSAELRYRLNFQSPLMAAFKEQQYIAYANTANNTVSVLERTARLYGADQFYASSVYPLASIPQQLLVQAGKENFGDTDMKSGNMTNYGYFTNAIHNSSYEFQDDDLLGRYITSTQTTHLKGIPVIVSAQEAASLFGDAMGIESEPSLDSAKPAWLKNVQQKLTDTTYQTCYRNSAEQTILQKIQQDYAEMQNHENDKSYVKPHLLYDYPKTACGDIPIVSDMRTKAEKVAATDQETLQRKSGIYIAPSHRLITYQIVGFIEATPYNNATNNVTNYVKNLLSYNDSSSMNALIPTRLYQQLPTSMKVDDISEVTQSSTYTAALKALGTEIVAFNSIEDARKFIDNETCPLSDTSCEKRFLASSYGSNYLILNQIGDFFAHVMRYAIPTVLIIAVLIMWFTLSRIMIDSRKETAVYRAMGATRPDIAAIYLTYTFLIIIRIIIFSFALGIGIAWLINYTYGNQLSSIATTAFGIQGNDTPSFSLFALRSPYLLVIPCIIAVICFLAVVQPLIRNVRRSPIKDMREE